MHERFHFHSNFELMLVKCIPITLFLVHFVLKLVHRAMKKITAHRAFLVIIFTETNVKNVVKVVIHVRSHQIFVHLAFLDIVLIQLIINASNVLNDALIVNPIKNALHAQTVTI